MDEGDVSKSFRGADQVVHISEKPYSFHDVVFLFF